MTIAQQVTAAHQYAELWRALMPDVDAPGEDQFLLWSGLYTESQVARGLSGAARKRRAVTRDGQSMTVDDLAAYASSIMKHEKQGVRRFNR